MRRRFFSLFCLCLAVFAQVPAFAQDSAEPAPRSWDETLDEAVGLVVAPIAGVFFFDLAVWDNPMDCSTAEDETPTQAQSRCREGAPSVDWNGPNVTEADRTVALATLNSSNEDGLSPIVGPSVAVALVNARPESGYENLDAALEVLTVERADIGTLISATTQLKLPLIVVWLVFGAFFFTLRYAFPNLRAFGHAIRVTKGDYDHEEDEGEVSHFQALASALSATVGLGNIAGVAVAVGAGGPGAVFWMIIAAFFGMSSKFSECTLGQLYRTVDTNGNVSGGPMRYLRAGLEEMGWPTLGKFLSIAFAIMCIGGSFGGGNMFQANQSYAQVSGVMPFLEGTTGKVVYGLILVALVAAVILGGIKRIGQVAGYIVPIMCGVYILGGFIVIFAHLDSVGMALGKIVAEAFSPKALGGGAIGVLMVGFQRAAFSNEAGVGSASIAHSAASTDEPVREGIVALLEPFIDTILVCTMTGIVVVITGAYQSGDAGVEMTSNAFDSVIPGFKYILSFAVFMFAFSTMISWSYYGERCWTFLFGTGSSIVYKGIFLAFAMLGVLINLGNVITFSDLMVLGMAFPNILGMLFLSGKVKRAFDEYWTKLKDGEFDLKG